MLAPGEYSFPFQFHIPNENLPTSVEGNFGQVRYWLKAFIDRPWRFDITTKAVFTVIEHVDINVLPSLLVSVHLKILWSVNSIQSVGGMEASYFVFVCDNGYRWQSAYPKLF